MRDKRDKLTTADIAASGETMPQDRPIDERREELDRDRRHEGDDRWAGKPFRPEHGVRPDSMEDLHGSQQVERIDERPAPPAGIGGPSRMGGPRPSDTRDAELLMRPEDLQEFRQRWTSVQTQFVDEPRKTVEDADRLVAETIQRLAQSFADARANLEHQWSRGEDVSTEELRLTLQRYRSFFDRLLAM